MLQVGDKRWKSEGQPCREGAIRLNSAFALKQKCGMTTDRPEAGFLPAGSFC